MHEYVLIFQNHGEWEMPHEEKFQLSEEFIKEVAWSVWPMRVSRLKGHPAPFPVELPERLIQLYSVKNETILDPFGGIGTTMKAAKNLGRDSIIYEINSEYLEAIKSTVDWDEKSKEYGPFMNQVKVFAHSPVILRHMMSMMFEMADAGVLRKRHLEIALVTVSRLNECRYCVAHHAPRLLDTGLSNEIVSNILDPESI